MESQTGPVIHYPSDKELPVARCGTTEKVEALSENHDKVSCKGCLGALIMEGLIDEDKAVKRIGEMVWKELSLGLEGAVFNIENQDQYFWTGSISNVEFGFTISVIVISTWITWEYRRTHTNPVDFIESSIRCLIMDYLEEMARRSV